MRKIKEFVSQSNEMLISHVARASRTDETINYCVVLSLSLLFISKTILIFPRGITTMCFGSLYGMRRAGWKIETLVRPFDSDDISSKTNRHRINIT